MEFVLLILTISIVYNIYNFNLIGKLRSSIKNCHESCLAFSTKLEFQRQSDSKIIRELKQRCTDYEIKIISLVGKHAAEIKAEKEK